MHLVMTCAQAGDEPIDPESSCPNPLRVAVHMARSEVADLRRVLESTRPIFLESVERRLQATPPELLREIATRQGTKISATARNPQPCAERLVAERRAVP